MSSEGGGERIREITNKTGLIAQVTRQAHSAVDELASGNVTIGRLSGLIKKCIDASMSRHQGDTSEPSLKETLCKGFILGIGPLVGRDTSKLVDDFKSVLEKKMSEG